MIRLLAHSPPPSAISMLSLFLSLHVCRRSSLLTERGKGDVRGAISYPLSYNGLKFDGANSKVYTYPPPSPLHNFRLLINT
jgi:hypothetical protein